MNQQTIKQIEKYDLETAMKRLDEVSERLSAENVSLEDSLLLYEEGVALVKHCNAQLEAVERKISILKMSSDGEIEVKPFDGATE